MRGVAVTGVQTCALPISETPSDFDDLFLAEADSLPVARDRQGIRLGEEKIVEVARRFRDPEPARIKERLFEPTGTAAGRERGESAQAEGHALTTTCH